MNQRTIFNLNFKMLDWGGTIKKITNFLTHNSTFTCIKKNKELANMIGKGKKAYVLALGPSLKNVNIYKIKGDTMVVNRFYKTGYLFPEFVPSYYMMIDYMFGEEENIKDFRAAIDLYLPKGTKFFLNSKLFGTDLVKNYPQENIYYLSSFGGDIHAGGQYRLDGILPAFQNVVGSAIMTLSLIGYKEINLLGCDFNSFASSVRIHCYEEVSAERQHRMSWELYAYAIVAHQYDVLQQYAMNNDFVVINSTKGSLIDAFPLKIDNTLYIQ